MISLKSLSKSYGAHTVIEGVSYTFPESGIVALMGASGLGKTTLLRLLCGLEKPSAGSIESNYRKVAVSFQEPRLIPWLDCEENLKFVLPKNNIDLSLINSILSALDMENAKKLLPDELSGGMKQRISLARALLVGADLLLLDEPFSALDSESKSRIYPLIKSANPKGLTVVITHDIEEARALDAKILLLEGSPVSALVPLEI